MPGEVLPHPHQAAANAPEGFFEEAARSALYAGVQSPLSGLAQLADHTTGAVASVFNCEGTNFLPSVQFMDAPSEAKFGTSSWYAQQFGGALGVAGDFWLVHKGLGAKAGAAGRTATGEAISWQSIGSLAKLEARHAAIAGALYGGVFTPTDPADGNFWMSRLRNSSVQAATFATLSSSTVGLSGLGESIGTKAPIFSAILKNDIVAGTLSGVPAGLVNANAESVLHGKGFASTQDVGRSVYSFAVIGGTLQAGNKLVGYAFPGGNHNASALESPRIAEAVGIVELPRIAEMPRIVETPRTAETPRIAETASIAVTPRSAETPRIAETATIAETPSIAETARTTETPNIAETPTAAPEQQGGFWKSMRKLIGLSEPIPVALGETPHESAQALGLKLPPMTEEQIALSQATVLDPKRDGRGSMGLEKYLTDVQLPDGTVQPAMIRMFPRGWGSTSRFRHEQAAYHLNSMMEFDNGFPTSALRTFERNGELVRAWIQDASGRQFGEGMRALAIERYGEGSDAAVSRMVKEDPRLRSQVEQAFVERHIYGDTDPSAFNMVLTPDLRVQNIDLDMSFHGSYQPDLTSSPAYGINHRLFNDFSGQPLLPSTVAKVNSFVRRYNNEAGRATLMNLGLSSSEANAMLSRAAWFARNRVHPEVRTLTM